MYKRRSRRSALLRAALADELHCGVEPDGAEHIAERHKHRGVPFRREGEREDVEIDPVDECEEERDAALALGDEREDERQNAAREVDAADIVQRIVKRRIRQPAPHPVEHACGFAREICPDKPFWVALPPFAQTVLSFHLVRRFVDNFGRRRVTQRAVIVVILAVFFAYDGVNICFIVQLLIRRCRLALICAEERRVCRPVRDRDKLVEDAIVAHRSWHDEHEQRAHEHERRTHKRLRPPLFE